MKTDSLITDMLRWATELEALRNEVSELRRWKEEAATVLAQWETVWIAAGKPGAFGTSKPLETAKLFLKPLSKQA